MMLPGAYQNNGSSRIETGAAMATSAPNPQRGRQPGPVPTEAQIIALVDAQERYLRPLLERMEADWSLKILEEFDAGEGYQSYTSNEPMTYFDKMTSSIASGKLDISIPVQRARRQQRAKESAAERFFIGVLRANDERLLLLGQPRLLSTLTGFINARGWYCGRSLFIKDPQTGETYVDITAWDPLHVTWGMGSKGLKWVCHKSIKTRAEVLDQYGRIPGELGGGKDYWDEQLATEGDGLTVYDWYDEDNNMVIVGTGFVKPPTRHSTVGRVPAFFGSVDYLPLIQSTSQLTTGNNQANIKHHGESIYAANRAIYQKVNLVLSTMLQLVALSRNHSFYLTGGDGTHPGLKTNPHLEGSQFTLPEGYEFNIVQLLEMSKDTGAFLGLVSAEVQRGALPYSVYGELAFQLSGYAVKLLKQATDSPTMPRVHAVENAIWQITNNLRDQFVTGEYDTIQLQGFGRNRDWFDLEFTPEMMVGLPSAEITLVVQTPQDDMAKLQMAKMGTDGPNPLYSMRYARDEILNVQDADEMDDTIKEERGETLLPEAMIWTTMEALKRKGEEQLYKFWLGQLIRTGLYREPGPNGQQSAAAQQNGAAGGGGYSPESLSAPEQGAPTPQPTPQGGANVPPGTPRPGARELPPAIAAWGQ